MLHEIEEYLWSMQTLTPCKRSTSVRNYQIGMQHSQRMLEMQIKLEEPLEFGSALKREIQGAEMQAISSLVLQPPQAKA
jgi:hypothetical protein